MKNLMGTPAQAPPTLAYREPRIADHGTLVQLTADFDAQFLGSVAKVVTMAQISAVVVGGPESGPTEAGTPGPTEAGTPLPDDTGGVLGDNVSGGDDTGNGSPVDQGTSGDAGDTAGDTASGGTGADGGGGGGAGAVVATENGGKLAFTGFPALGFAAAGAALTTAGVVLRSKLRRT